MKEIVKSIPTKVSLDIPEVEFSKADKLVLEKVKDTLKEKNIELTNINIDVSVSPIYLPIQYFYTGYVYLQYKEEGNYTYYDSNYHEENGYSWSESYSDNTHYINFTIDINVEYNNHSKYNSTDEQAVKNLLLTSPKYITYSIDDFYNGIFTHIANYYQKQVFRFIPNCILL